MCTQINSCDGSFFQAVVARCLQAPMSANTGFYGVSLYLAACEVTRRLQAASVTASYVDE